MIAQGLDHTDIGGCLYISNKTVSSYRSDILRKVKGKTDIDLLRLAIFYQLISQADEVETSWM